MRFRRLSVLGLSVAIFTAMAGYGNDSATSTAKGTKGALAAARGDSQLAPNAKLDPQGSNLVQNLVVTSSATPTAGTAPLNVAFTCQAKGGLAPYKYTWKFGDNTTSTLQNPKHVYSTTAKFTAVVTVKDSRQPNPGQASAPGITFDLTHASEQLPTSWETNDIKF